MKKKARKATIDENLRKIIEEAVDDANHGYCETSHDCEKEMEELVNNIVTEIESLYSNEKEN